MYNKDIDQDSFFWDSLRSLLSDNEKNVVSANLDETEAALLAFAQQYALPAPASVRTAVLEKISRLINQASQRQHIDLERPPRLETHTNPEDWQDAVKHIQPPADFDNIYLHPIYITDELQQFVAFVRHIVPEEVHHDMLESFLLLEGACQCDIIDQNGNARVVHMRAGDFMSFETGDIHVIRIVSGETAKGILQWAAIAA